MDLAIKLTELQKRVTEHREALLTEEAAKTAFVMPFIQALGYDVFNPSEVIPNIRRTSPQKRAKRLTTPS